MSLLKSRLQGAKILIVDDEPTNVALLEDMLDQFSYTTLKSTNDPCSVLPIYREWRPDIILLDMMMPILDGIGVMDEIRSDPQHEPNVPILMLTADPSPATKRRALAGGAKDFLTKPFDALELRLRIDNLLETHFLHLDLQEQNETLELHVLERTSELNSAKEDVVVYTRQLERLIAQSEQLLAAIPSILIAVDDRGDVMMWNTSAEEAFGIQASATLGFAFPQSGIQWNWDAVMADLAACRESLTILKREAVPYCAADGQDHLLDLFLNPITGNDAQVTGLLLVAIDVTDQRMLETMLAQAQKLESIGRLAAGIAHEINTPIQYVGDNVNFLKAAFSDIQHVLELSAGRPAMCRQDQAAAVSLADIRVEAERVDIDYLLDEVPKAIAQSQEGIDRVTGIVRSMKVFSHPGTSDKAVVNLNDALESTITVARNEWRYVADIVTAFDSSLPAISCFPAEINQVFLNLITNAAHAIGDIVGDGSNGKGTITVTTLAYGDFVEVRVRDTGAGIPDEIRSKIFNPFFTTKEVGRGTGQGLSICHAVVVEKHKGAISFETQAGEGTTFHIRLPVDNS